MAVQEEEREKLYNTAPKQSRVTTDPEKVRIEQDVIDMLEQMGYSKLMKKKYLQVRELGTK